ncbi:MAG: hypothetical protein ABIP94_11595, partial [Planctomycetota bacterium]
TNSVAMAVSNDGVLHITWGRLTYPTFFQQFYRAVDPVAGAAVTGIVDVTAQVGATTASRTDSIDIAAVDNAGSGQPGVYFTAQTTSNWINQLMLLQRTGGSWAGAVPVNLGLLSTSASSQQARLALTPNGVVHICFYNNAGNGDLVHRSFDGSAWSAQTILGDGTVRRDFSGDISADIAGTVHAVYNHWLSMTQSELHYRTLVAGTWSNAIVVHVPQNTADLDNRFSLAADVFGKAYVVYFDASDAIVYQAAQGGVFGAAVTLLPSGLAVPGFPAVRGSVFPPSNRQLCELDVVHRWIPSTPEQLFWQREITCSCNSVAIGFPGSWAPGATGTVALSGATPGHIALVVLGVDLLPLPVPVLSCPCPLFVTPDVLALAIVDAAGAAQVLVPVPLAPVGTTLWAQWLSFDLTLSSCGSSLYGARYVP